MTAIAVPVVMLLALLGTHGAATEPVDNPTHGAQTCVLDIGIRGPPDR